MPKLTKKSEHKCFKLKRIAIVKCHYAVPEPEITKLRTSTETEKNKYIINFLKKYNLDKKKINENSMSYYFEVNDEIPLELPEKDIHLNYVYCKVPPMK